MKDSTNKIIYVSSAVIFMGLIAGAFYVGVIQNTDATENDTISSRTVAYAETPSYLTEDMATLPAVEEVKAPIEDRITANTKIIYEYFYGDNQETVKYEEAPKYFQLDKTEVQFKELYDDWDIVSFSNSEVVLRKAVEMPRSRSYTVGVYNGNIAVFYADVEDGADALKEVTSTPITSLSEAEQAKLANGIPISDDDALIKILEDYSS